MKLCPLCGLQTDDAPVVCPADGTPLVDGARATTMPMRRSSVPWCAACGAREGETGAVDCPRCGSRMSAVPSTLPGASGSKLAGFTVARPHGDGDVLIAMGTGVALLVLGAKGALDLERAALESPATGAGFPAVLAEGFAPDVGDYLVLSADLEGRAPMLDANLGFAEGVSLVRSVLDQAAELETRGFGWEPAPTDLYLRGSAVQAVRVRGARKLAAGEPLNVKPVLEALAGALLPEPFGWTTPDVVRLLLPPMNFSSVRARTIAEARADLARAEALWLAGAAGADDLAELCDPGLRRPQGEDATAVASGVADGEPFAVLVVCDGVSSSTRAGEAATLASLFVRDALATFAQTTPKTVSRARAPVAVADAIRAAHAAVCDAHIEPLSGAPPGTTIVAALVQGRSLTVGWLGDSRAYWVSADDAELCTSDHSWLNEAVARGAIPLAEALESPFAHALTKCLGPLEANLGSGVVDPDVRTRALSGPGHVVLCTDGLWNYFPAAEAIAELVRGAGQGASTVARFLVCRALAEGGGDNVSVAVHRVS